MKIRKYQNQTVQLIHKTSHGESTIRRVIQIRAGRKRPTQPKERTQRWQPLGCLFRVASAELTMA